MQAGLFIIGLISGSTRSVADWVKAMALTLFEMAAEGKRKFALIHFASKDKVKVDQFEPGKYTNRDVMAAMEHFFGGGTNFEAPLDEALKLIEQDYDKADVTIITDGEYKLNENYVQRLHQAKERHQVSITGIMLDKDADNKYDTLDAFCDQVYHSRDMTEDAIASRVIAEKTA